MMTKPEPDKLIAVTNCPACGLNNTNNIFLKEKFTAKRCTECGLIFISPILQNYEAQYKRDSVSSRSNYYLLSEQNDKKTFSERLAILEQFCGKETLFDIGCSTGTFMLTAIARGWKQVSGIDPNYDACRICSERNLQVFNSFFNSSITESLKNKFEAVYTGDVIEHTHNPKEFITDVRRILTDGGCIMISVPDYESIVARLFQIKPSEHLIYFTEKSLASLLQNNGFKIELLKKTTRRRTFQALKYSSTFKNKFFGNILTLLGILKADIFINLCLRLFVRDELLIIGRKT